MTAISKPSRRTQSQRRAATQQALLDATIACLVESGYTNTTTAQISKRAGVTRGAQAHHFPTKNELVTAAVRHLTERLVTEHLTAVSRDLGSFEDTLSALLDQLWALHSGPLFAAASELWIAARTDPALATHVEAMERDILDLVIRTERDIVDLVVRTGNGVLPVPGEAKGSAAMITITLATMRGLAMLTFVSADHKADKEWAQARRQLVRMWREVLEPAIAR